MSREPVESTSSRASDSRPSDHRLQPCARTHACALARAQRLPRWRWLAVAGVSSPEWQHGRCRVTNFDHRHLTPKGCSTARRLPNVNSLQPCRPSTSRVPCSMAPHVAPPLSLTEANPFGGARTLSACRAPTRHPFKARSALHRQVPPLGSSLALEALLRGPPLNPRLCHR